MAKDPVGDLLTLLDLERLELDLFRGQSPDEEESQRVFGGRQLTLDALDFRSLLPQRDLGVVNASEEQAERGRSLGDCEALTTGWVLAQDGCLGPQSPMANIVTSHRTTFTQGPDDLLAMGTAAHYQKFADVVC